ncbi:fructose PTS transporter subunit IIA [Streptococcus merionis]|uniref:PTS system transporter protein n=1 Tax=Streptococcus merionis TaxID=400065 RepID=A0A239SQ79_9STRE|nr:fructose PTS transporter subunit IIA [Streptococcus merionis]SNU87615.1 PTS system transporter protein [Streptococcus merionis]
MVKIISEDSINLSLEGDDKNVVIKNLAKQIYNTGVISDLEIYYQSVLEREEMVSTGIGFNIAIPHGKSSAVNTCAVGFARLVNDLDWQSLDGEPVKMIFLLAIPEECAGNEHLKIIAALSRQLIHEEFRQKLENLMDKKSIAELINGSLKHIDIVYESE